MNEFEQFKERMTPKPIPAIKSYTPTPKKRITIEQLLKILIDEGYNSLLPERRRFAEILQKTDHNRNFQRRLIIDVLQTLIEKGVIK